MHDVSKSGFIETNKIAGILSDMGHMYDEEKLDGLIDEIDVEGESFPHYFDLFEMFLISHK